MEHCNEVPIAKVYNPERANALNKSMVAQVQSPSMWGETDWYGRQAKELNSELMGQYGHPEATYEPRIEESFCNFNDQTTKFGVTDDCSNPEFFHDKKQRNYDAGYNTYRPHHIPLNVGDQTTQYGSDDGENASCQKKNYTGLLVALVLLGGIGYCVLNKQ